MITQLIDNLRQSGELHGELPPAPVGVPVSRWIIALQVAGAWLAALFLLIFVGLGAASFVKSGAGWMFLGLLATGGAALGLRAASGMVSRQFLLALSLAGQGAFALGVAEKSGWRVVDAWWLVVFFEAAVFAAVGWAAHRLLAALLMLWAVQLALADPFVVDAFETGGLSGWLVSVYWAAACALWSLEPRWRVRRQAELPAALATALATALAIYCLGGVLVRFAFDLGAAGLLRPGRHVDTLPVLLSFICLAWLGWQLWRGRRGWLLLASLAGLCAATWQAPGIAMGLTALVFGFARGHRWLLWLGGAVMLAAVGRYYYFLPVGLLEKSGLLVLGGFVLLALRALLGLEAKA